MRRYRGRPNQRFRHQRHRDWVLAVTLQRQKLRAWQSIGHALQCTPHCAQLRKATHFVLQSRYRFGRRNVGSGQWKIARCAQERGVELPVIDGNDHVAFAHVSARGR